MVSQPILLKDASIINEGTIYKGHLLLHDGKIERILPAGNINIGPYPNDIKTYNLDGLWVIPGIIDDQVHFREPGFEHKADIQTESMAAVAGGITSYMEMPNTNPQTTTQSALEKKFALAAEKSLANYSFYIGATNKNIDELRATDKNNVCGIKVFMGSSTGNMLVDNAEVLKTIFRIKKLPIATHCEDEATIKANMAYAEQKFGSSIPFGQHPVIRSHEACEISTRLAISLAERYETRLHILHLSTANELLLLDHSTELDKKMITAEVCIHHLWFSDDDYATKGPWIKWNPAVKGSDDRKALMKALLAGYLDVVATDHAPHTIEEKQRPYASCPSGGPMVQHALPAMLEFFHKGMISLEKIVELMCHNPAICFNIRNRGFIREGYAADLVVIAPERSCKVSKENLLYKCNWSPFEGQTFRSSIDMTFVNGRVVYEKGIFNDGVKGQALTFSR
jgi:dihydroorotase